MAKRDPHDADPPHTYECADCAKRVEEESRPGDCPECGGHMRNISRPREK